MEEADSDNVGDCYLVFLANLPKGAFTTKSNI